MRCALKKLCYFPLMLGVLSTQVLAENYDVVVNNGRVIDPESGLDAIRHVGIVGGEIKEISRSPLEGATVVDATGLIVAPGFIDTDMTQTLTDEQKEGIFSQVPANRLGKPEEIASTVAFLASDAAAYITGETIHVNGGMYMV